MFTRIRVVAVGVATVLLMSAAPPAMAAAPDAPTLVGPADGSTAATPEVPLSVRASDPDGDSLDVRFVGRKVGATVPGGPQGSPFAVVALPDTQNYTYAGRQGTILQQGQWAVNTRAQLNTAMVVQLGDLVSEYDNLLQWDRVSAGLKVMDDANLPNTVVPGNHDFNNATGEFAQYDTYFPPSRYADKPWTPSTARYGGYLGQNLFGPDPVNRRNMDNFALFSAGGRDFLVLNLEWEAPQYALDWAAKVLAAYPDRIAIMTTHSFVGIDGQRRTTAERPGGTPANTLWTNFVFQQCSIRLVLNGHFHNGNLGEANRSDLNRCGQPVQQILTDYQDRANGGDGWLRYYTFDPAANTMTAATYSPKLNQFETDANSAFTVPFDLRALEPAPFTTIGTDQIASGGTAGVTWTGLEPDTLYEWRAIADDGGTTTTSPTWTVRTPPSSDLVDDTFTRTLTNGWGAVDASHAWQLNSSAASYSVNGSQGRATVPVGAGRGGTVSGVSGADVRVTTDLSLTQAASGSGTYVSVLARASGPTSYRAKMRYLSGGSLTLAVTRYVNGAETTLAAANVAGVTATPGLPLRLRLETEGTSPTTVRAKVWPISGTEPATWTATATDATAALQSAGTAGLDLYTSSTAAAASALAFDRFTVTRLGATPPPVNQEPTAVIGTPVINGRTVNLSGTGSTDPDGTIAGYAWNFGDSTTGTGATPGHTYTADGTYTVTLTVTDDDGATNTASRQVTVSAPPANQEPNAVIGTPVINGRTVNLSGTGSTDPDGTIAGYAWNFGDSTTGTGATPSHTYTADGTYTVTLTVTDDDGATDTASRQVSVTAPPPGALARDGFGRTVSNAWGVAEAGGSWTTSGAASRYSVASGTGRQTITAPGTTADSMLTSVSSAATDLRLTIAWSRTASAGTLYASVLPRRVTSANDYRCKVVGSANGAMQLSVVRRVNSAETTIGSSTISGLTLAANQTYNVACRAAPSGNATQLTGKLWRSGTSEPATWQVSAIDSTAALQTTGGIGVTSYLSSGATTGVTLSVDDLVALTP